MSAQRRITVVALLTTLLCASRAGATPILGGRSALMGGAAVAQGRDEAVFWLNPAGLTAIDRSTLNLSLNVYGYHTFKVTRHFGDSLARGAGSWRDDGVSQSVDIFPGSMGFFLSLGEPGKALHQVIGVGFLTLAAESWDFAASFRQSGISSYAYERRTKGEEYSYAAGAGYAIRLPANISLGASVMVRWTTGSWDFSDSVDSYSTVSRNHTGLSYNDIGETLRVSLATAIGARWQSRVLSLGLSVRLPDPVLHQSIDGVDKTVLTQGSGGGAQSGLRGSGNYKLVDGLSRQYLEPSIGAAIHVSRLTLEVALTLAIPLAGSSTQRLAYSNSRIESGQAITTDSQTLEASADFPLAFTLAAGAELSLGSWSVLVGGTMDRARIAYPESDAQPPALGWALDLYSLALGLGYGGKLLKTYVGVQYIYGKGSFSGAELDLQSGAAPASARPMQDHRVLFTLSGSVRMPKLFGGGGS